jgi:hypothetical protein
MRGDEVRGGHLDGSASTNYRSKKELRSHVARREKEVQRKGIRSSEETRNIVNACSVY